MKRSLYTIADEEFATLLERAHAAFAAKGMKYMLVGGVATQAHIISNLCRSGKTLMDFVVDPKFRLQDFLRATDDVDITLSPEKNGELMTPEEKVKYAEKVFSVLDEIVGDKTTYGHGLVMSPTDEHLVAISLERKGLARPVFMLGLDSEPTGDKTVSFNLFKGPEDTNPRWGNDIVEFERRFYDDFMNRGVELKIPFSDGKDIALRVKKVEDLLATKIIRGRDKDLGDTLSLARHSERAGTPIDYEAIRRLLSSNDPKYDQPNLSFVEKFEKFMNIKDSYRGE
ncbi:MAG TPA: hypothetical protein VI544_01130 [Candidatus Nanoarchaeia archaeon]|nr:hypothetical protein [Candidatus Nanoarchaeia archaeon]